MVPLRSKGTKLLSIVNEYLNITFNSDDSSETNISYNNPDQSLNGAEVSRYTFLEYFNFLINDIQTNGSYVTSLNKKMETEHSLLNKSNSSYGSLGEINLNTLEKAKEEYVKEYKGSNWALANDINIPFANDTNLWNKVDNLYK